MARKPRLYTETGIYHVIMRGNNKENIFYDDSDRKYFLMKMELFAKKEKIKIYCYCLMSNHVHILIGEANPSMSKFIQRLSLSYVRRFNRKYDCTGHLFQGRFKSEPIYDEKQYKTTYRYILQNPEKAYVSKHDEYFWNSYKTILNNDYTFLDKKTVFNIFGNKTMFIEFVSQTQNDNVMEYENMFVFNDKKCCEIIYKLFKIKSPIKLIQMSKEEQKNKLMILKSIGIPVNQLSRLTGISRYIIKSA